MFKVGLVVVLALGGASLGGCAQTAALTPDNQMCNFVTIPIEVAAPPIATPPAPFSPLAKQIDASLTTYDSTDHAGAPPLVLTLSGGSEHGAFGAGVLGGWSGNGTLPEFQVVTGISTGSILSTFAFVGDSATAVQGYTIDSESELLTVYAKPTDGKIGPADYAALLEHGSFANLEPLRTRLSGYLTDDVMQQVATRYADGARLYVGATDADSGHAVAFDLGDMATRYVTNAQGKAAQWKSCYVSAIIASSSAPMAAPPAFIDNTMYIDGGTRFGLFSDSVLEVFHARKHGAGEHAPGQRDPGLPPAGVPVVYSVIDGTLKLPPPKCPKEDASLCTPSQPLGPADGQHRKWNIMDLLLSTEHILVNQVYRFSAEQVQADACEQAGCFNFLRIEDDVSTFQFTYTDPTTGQPAAKTCPQWAAIDDQVDDPIEFQKRYMRCLIAYGKAKVAAAGWGMPQNDGN
ncbi:MAG: patatin-like phospholipase family protein [Sphingomonadaceae bacterium]|nr:patatin-like phospholipase family protein [Sphingomonadaceae bacterium]